MRGSRTDAEAVEVKVNGPGDRVVPGGNVVVMDVVDVTVTANIVENVPFRGMLAENC